MNDITVFIAEDEPRARQMLRRLVLSDDRLLLTGSAADGRTASEEINLLKPDLLFLDINMPLLSGIDVMKNLEYTPQVVFTTAYEEYAVTAFELQALDYLLKPFGPRRFDKAVSRAVGRLQELSANSASIGKETPGAMAESTAALALDTSLTRIYVRHNKLRVPVKLKDITVIEACDDYAMLHTNEQSYLSPVRMKVLESQFRSAGFIRVHRSWIVNTASIRSLEYQRDGRVTITMTDDRKVQASRAGAALLKQHVTE